MLKKKYVIVGFLTFCLTVAIFIGATTSQLKPYDPWFDYLDDGKTNYEDLFYLADRYGATGTPLDKAAIAYNSTVVYAVDETTSISSVDMYGTSVMINITRPSDLLIMFSAEAMTNNSNCRIVISARVDGGYAVPPNCMFTPTVSPTMGHSHTLSYMAYAFNFLYSNAGAGTHTVKIQWRITSATQSKGLVYYRTLAVMAVNQ